MCGVAGFVSATPGANLGNLVGEMTRRMVRRGPDSSGFHQFDSRSAAVGFGHRRLAIIDLSPAGHQPMLTTDGKTGVVFNGCIYNFLELRRQLEQMGHRFVSQCDTEVLLHGYTAWGIDVLASRLRGMFAFAIWDDRLQRLFLVRDRMGVKPLVYAARNGNFAFASTISALRCSGLTGEINPLGVLEFLEFGWLSEEQCIYQGAHKVAPASIVEWNAGQISSRRYWQLPEPGSRNMSFEQAVDQAQELILESVRLRLISDVPIAALLSAGIDSSLVCWALSELKAPVHSYTVATPGDPADESAEAAETARLLKIPHEVIALPPDSPPSMDDLINAYSEPFACSSALGMLQVCRAVKPRATVLLTGDGGDDIFLGYPHYRHFRSAERLANLLPGFATQGWRALPWRPNQPKFLRRAAHLLDYAAGGLGAVTAQHDGLPYYRNAQMLGQRLDPLQIASREIAPSLASSRRLLSDFHAYELQTRFVSEYMTKVDGATMFHAIEARSPLLDQNLWEFAAGLSHDVRLHQGESKAVLKQIVRRRLGPQVAARRKRGFTVPVERWLVTTWRPQLECLAEDSLLESQGWIRKGSLGPAVRRGLQGTQAPVQLWYLAVLESWLRHSAVDQIQPMPEMASHS